eukprot:GHVL01015090.1.p1 GENE.GHVL01015090.1~~GHVL01015090.1.p1  ORF type:complete len:123 (+),score=15.49 GHVL01015090.1:20-388(+)
MAEKVLMVSSLDHRHPPENVIDGDEMTFWMTTGIFPQFLILKLQKKLIKSVKVRSCGVQRIMIEGVSHQNDYDLIGETDVVSKRGQSTISSIPIKSTSSLELVKIVVFSDNSFSSISSVEFF